VPYYFVIRGLSGCTIFFRVVAEKARLVEKVLEHKMCVLISVQLCLKHFSF
jgi:hypothetical protein